MRNGRALDDLEQLTVVVLANPKQGRRTAGIANLMGISQRTVQVLLKKYREMGRSAFLRSLMPPTTFAEKNSHVCRWAVSSE